MSNFGFDALPESGVTLYDMDDVCEQKPERHGRHTLMNGSIVIVGYKCFDYAGRHRCTVVKPDGTVDYINGACAEHPHMIHDLVHDHYTLGYYDRRGHRSREIT